MDGLHIRPARVGEGRAIAEMKRRSWQAAYAGLLPDDFLAGLDLQPPPEHDDERSAGGRGPTLALLEGDVVGVAGVGDVRDEDVPDGTSRTETVRDVELTTARHARGL